MRIMKAKSKTVPFIVIITLLMAAEAVVAQPSYSPSELVFTVYADGVVAIDYTTDVDPTQARVNITLFGSLYQDLIVEDQDGLPLDFSTIDGGLTVDTLASTSVSFYYVTPDLTNKSAQTWVFSVSTNISSSILLPEGATITDLNVDPLTMSSLDGSPVLTMPAGEVVVTYTIGIVGTREHALALIKDAETTIETIKTDGILLDEAEAVLQQAYAAFNAENYVEAEQYATKSKTLAKEIESAASSAEEAIGSASASISAARDEGRTVGLDDAETLLQQAEESYEIGDYDGAKSLAEQSQIAAEKAEEPEEPEEPEKPKTPYTWIVIGAVAVTIALAAAVFALRGKPAEEVEGEVDLEALFEEKPHLRLDDRDVIRFLAESGGEAFATEIRERFGIPRTSAWRMIRRLQREDVVEVRQIGGQSLVRIRPKYRRGGVA